MESLTTKSPSPPNKPHVRRDQKPHGPLAAIKTTTLTDVTGSHGPSCPAQVWHPLCQSSTSPGCRGSRPVQKPYRSTAAMTSSKSSDLLVPEWIQPSGVSMETTQQPRYSHRPRGLVFIRLHLRKRKNPKNDALGITTDQSCPLFPKAEPRALLIGTTLSE